MSCGVGHKCGSDLALLWLWQKPPPTALFQPLAWELPYATGTDLKKNKQKTNRKLKIDHKVKHKM